MPSGFRWAPPRSRGRHRPLSSPAMQYARRHEVIRAHIKSAIRNAEIDEGYGPLRRYKRETRESEADPQAKATGSRYASSTLTWFW